MNPITKDFSEQPIKLVFDHPVALTDGFFQFLAVENLDVTAEVTECPLVLQATGSSDTIRE